MELYNYYNSSSEFEIKPADFTDNGNRDNIRKFVLSFKSPYESSSEINNNVYTELFLKEDFFTQPVKLTSAADKNLITDDFKFFNNDIPLLIFLHGFSTKNEKLKNYYKFIINILNHDIACLFINLPFHLNRKPTGEASGRRIIYYDDLDTLLFFHQCVVDVRKSIDIIGNILSLKEINICGISLGSLVSIITMAVEKKVNKGVFIFGGGNWEEIHWNGILRFVLKGNCAGSDIISRGKCHLYYSNFSKFLEKVKSLNPDKFTTEVSENCELNNLCTKKCYLCDPLTFAYKINPEKVLMINSKIDHLFSRKSTSSLWEELGRPEIHWFNYFHLSGIINKKEILRTITGFLDKK